MKRLTTLATFAFLFFTTSFLILIVVALPHFVQAEFVCCYTDQDLSLVVGDVLIEGPVGLFDDFAGEIPPPVVVNGDTLSSSSQSITINFLERPHRDRPLQIVKAFDVSVPKERGVYLLHRIPNDPTPENGPEGDILIPGTFSLVYAPVPANDGNIDTLESATITFPDLPALGDPVALSGRYLLSVFQLPETKYVYDSVLDDYIEVPYTEADLLAWYEWQFLDYDFYDGDIPEYAGYAPDAEAVFTIDEYIGATTIEQGCCSSILFLPGIQASRLYMERSVGPDDQLWTPAIPFGNQDVEQLAMDVNGNSINEVFTKDIVDEVFGLGSVYGGFSDFLEDKKTATLPIKDYTEFAYDWRYDVHDIVVSGTRYKNEIKSIVEEFEKLADTSYTGKVIIIGHSNGGLLGKALITELERIGKANQIDKFIMIGTPQLGTPKAIGTLLHAYDQELGYGFVVDDYTAREVINNMPGAYGLLPSEKYIQTSDEPIITFDISSTTAPYRLAFDGSVISSFDTYKDFLSGSQGPARTLEGPISSPATTNSSLMETAFENHRDQLDDWQAPDNVEVIEIIGTGLPTPKAIEYREIFEGETCVNVNNQTTCTPKALLKAYAVLTKYGDQTVVQRSATAYEGDKSRYFVNLRELNESVVSNQSKPFVHFNLTEIPQVQQLIDTFIGSTSVGAIEYISTAEADFDDEYDVEVIDSPVRMVTEDGEGNITGVVLEDGQMVIKEEIPGSQYFEMGGTKYLVIPKGIKRITRLYGEETGNYTLTISNLNSSDGQIIEHQLENATVTPQMVASYSSDEGEFSTVTTDLDGDGLIDTETTIDGELIRFTYADLNQAIKDTKLARIPKRALLKVADAAKRAGDKKVRYPLFGRIEDVLLDQAVNLITLYKQKKLITDSEFATLNKIILDIKSQ